MSRAKLHYADQRNDAIALVADLAHTKSRDDAVWSNPGTKAEAYAYRHRIYRWRRTVLALLAHHDSKEARQVIDDLRPVMGPRFNKDWLDYTRFDVVPLDDTGLYRVKGSIGRVMYGPDLVFADNPEHVAEVDEMRALLDLAVRAKS